MMISPETYYEMELKGKSQQEILKKIRSLKREINKLKKLIEEYDPSPDAFIMPDGLTRIKCNRGYLKKAIQAYEDAGGRYIPTKQEQRSQDFNRILEDLHCLKFSIGGFFGGYETRTYTVRGDKVMLDVENTIIAKPSNLPMYYPFTKTEFIDGLRNLHIGEWKRDYMNPYVLDGAQWNLEIQYNGNRKPVRFSGSNAYPYNFDDLTEFLGINEKADNESDDEYDEGGSSNEI